MKQRKLFKIKIILTTKLLAKSPTGRFATICFAVFGSLLFNPSNSYAFDELPYPKGRLDAYGVRAGLAGRYYNTANNFDGSGQSVALPTGNAAHLSKGIGFFEIGINERFSFFSEVDYIYNAVETSAFQNSGTGLGHLSAGLQFYNRKAPVYLLATLAGKIPLYSRAGSDVWSATSNTVSVPLGDGASQLLALGGLEIPLSENLYIGGGVGFLGRTQGYSSAFPYRAYLRYEKRYSVFFKVGVAGQQTSFSDKYTDEISPADRSNAVLGDSEAFNATNPSFGQFQATLGGYLTDTTFLGITGGADLYGKNSSQGFFVSGALGFEFSKPNEKGTPDYHHSNRGFQTYSMEAKVIQVNNRLKQALINKGLRNGIQLGELLDIFGLSKSTAPENSSNQAIGRAKVIEAGPTRSKIEVLEFFTPDTQPVRIEEGFVVRRPIR